MDNLKFSVILLAKPAPVLVSCVKVLQQTVLNAEIFQEFHIFTTTLNVLKNVRLATMVKGVIIHALFVRLGALFVRAQRQAVPLAILLLVIS